MNLNKKHYLLLILGVIIVSLGGYYFLNNKENNEVQIGDIKINLPEGATITQIPIESNIKQPSLDREYTYPDFFSAEAKKIMEGKINDTISNLKEDPNSFGNWIDLAGLYITLEEYDNAIEIYEYLNLAAPTNSISFANLGNLYHFRLKDFEKAEENLKKAVENSPSSIHAQRSLYELYLYSYKKDTNLAETTLLNALDKNPDNIDILVLLAQFYGSKNDKEKAVKYYKLAQKEAENAGNINLSILIQDEIDSLNR